ncbi:MAG: 30S ribosomal protein S5 [Patescibacteria group bacterium]|nr:30S ribosomal protein S5 [Patescibacteria group bacterium]MDD5221601.1 30S ribosomal protein S5 [Patescibacteria group bacterium]MDD5396043.1 30S ribosomal protein S5 [Patescibacteria group bacterium]
MIEKKRRRREGPEAGGEKEFDQRLLDLARVTRVTAGGKQLRFRACVAIGDKKGRVGIGTSKGPDVSTAIEKAVRQAKKNVINVSIVNETIPHWVKEKYGAASILLRPAGRGKGIIAGSVIRIITELAGISNITAKILGSNNKIANAKATINALLKLKKMV